MEKKMTTAEKLISGMMQTFVESQRDSKECFLKYEARWTKEEPAHEEHILRLLIGTPSYGHSPPYFPPHPSMFYNQPSHQPQMQPDNDHNE